MSTPQPPSVDELAAARLAHWRQNAASGADEPTGAILTLEAARQFVSTCGLLLFTARPQLISSPAPSFVEATLGATNITPSLAEVGEARTLLARLIAEGSAVPLNLLGASSATPDTPDFVASAATFAYVFTLRGEKAFKQLPSTSGATKVSPLALNTYNLLLENGPASASDLAGVLGKEVTEAAVLRALTELWQHLRVLPVPRAEGGSTVWETVTSRFTKQLKAGANAGQPSALSALISLYLSQALLATENDVETFLSPLAPRSRIRDVLHALSGARQLETIAVEGKTHLHIHGELPSFGAGSSGEAHEEIEVAPAGIELAEDGTRIKKFVAKPRKTGTGFVERAKPFRGKVPSDRETRSFERRTPSRPVDGRSRPAKPTFHKPWEEEKRERLARSGSEQQSGEVPHQDVNLEAASDAPRVSRAALDPRTSKRPFGTRPGLESGRSGSFSRPKFGGDRPAFGRKREGSAPDRPGARDGAGGKGAPFETRKPYAKSGYGDRKEGSFGVRPPLGDKERRPFRREGVEEGARPARRQFSAGRGEENRPKRDSFSKPGSFRGRPDGPAQNSDRPERPPFRKFDAPRGPRKPFSPREEGSFRPARREFPDGAKAEGRSRPGPSRGGPGEDRGRREGSSFGRRETAPAGRREDAGSFGPKRPTGSKPAGFGKKPFAGKPAGRRAPDAAGASTFDKFKGGNKPWGKRPPGRKPKPEKGEA